MVMYRKAKPAAVPAEGGGRESGGEGREGGKEGG